MKKFLTATLFFLFPAISFASNCKLIEARGNFDADYVCELQVSEDQYNEIFDADLLDSEEFSFNGGQYRIVLESNIKEKWIPVVDDLKVLTKDVKKAVRKASSTAMTSMGLTDKEQTCIISVSGTVGQSLACTGCFAAATGSAGVLASICAKPCGLASGALVAAIISCRGK